MHLQWLFPSGAFSPALPSHSSPGPPPPPYKFKSRPLLSELCLAGPVRSWLKKVIGLTDNVDVCCRGQSRGRGSDRVGWGTYKEKRSHFFALDRQDMRDAKEDWSVLSEIYSGKIKIQSNNYFSGWVCHRCPSKFLRRSLLSLSTLFVTMG